MLVLLIMFGYLLHVCFMPYIKVLGVTPNILYVNIAIITVAYGKLRAFWAGTIYGLLTQIMCPSVSYLNLALYTLTTLFCSFAFADKPIKTIEYERAVNRRRKEIPAWLRTLLCATLNITIYEIIQVTYIYIGGSPITSGHILRAFADILLTSLLALLLMFPVRRLILGKRADAPGVTIAPVVFSSK